MAWCRSHNVIIAAVTCLTLVAWGGSVQASSLTELSVTVPAAGVVAAGVAGAVGGNPAPVSPQAAAADNLPPAPAYVSDENEEDKKLDNSRTDINLFNRTVSDKNRTKSLLFTQEEINDIHLAINTYLKYIGRGGDLTFDEEAFLSRLGGLKSNSNPENRFFTYPQFFLDSLVYHSPDDWIIWVNGEKITNATPKENNNIHVVSIDADKATIAWFPLSMDKVLDVWKKFPNETVEVDKKHGQVIFSLRPNQTFSSYVMKVLEGKVVPVTVDAAQAEVFTPLSDQELPPPTDEELLPAAAPSPAIGAAPQPIPAAPTPAQTVPASREGLGGLINRYENLNKE
jgi:hypothetical protein